MIIDNEIRDLAHELESNKGEVFFEATVRKLIDRLRRNCKKIGNASRYSNMDQGELEAYPFDTEGNAKTFDPLSEEGDFFEQWKKLGVVVGRQVVSPDLQNKTIDRIKEMLAELTQGEFNLEKPETWQSLPKDKDGNCILSRGFLEIYHDHALAELRQSVRVYLHHVLIWGREDLWTTFDRLGLKLPGHHESKALPLHVDQNPKINPDFKGIQGILALVDCPVERGTIVLAPGSKAVFDKYRSMVGKHNEGDYVQLNDKYPIADLLKEYAKPLPIRAGDLVSWDSRTTHANTNNTSDQSRIIALISAGPAWENDSLALKAREEAFRTGMGSNANKKSISPEVRHRALMAASVKPRYISESIQDIRKPEQLNLLGQLLYSQHSYGEI